MHYWDPDRLLARQMGRALGISPSESVPDGDIGIAWDVYLAYGHGDNAFERPDFWMHQLSVEHAPRLDAAGWRLRIEALLSQPNGG